MCRRGDCLSTALFWVSVPVWLPAYILIVPPYHCGRSIWRKHIGPVREYPVQKPVPKQRRPRKALSAEKLNDEFSLSEKSDGETKTSKRTPCGFWKLPIELRMMIWKELLLLEYDGDVEVCLWSNKSNDINLFSYDAVRNLDATILRLDRRFYLEGMNILYMQNVFRMRGEAILSSFSRRVAPSRLAQIHTLHFAIQHWIHDSGNHRRCLTFNSQVWKETCEELKKFTGLRQLRITIKLNLGQIYDRCSSDPVWCQAFFGRVFDPLVPIKVLDGGEFTVGYTWYLGICDSWPRGSFEMKHLEEGIYWW